MKDYFYIVFAAFAVSSLLTEYEGPKNVFALLRERYPRSALKCLVCTSVYISIVFFIISQYVSADYFQPLSMVGIFILIERIKWN